MQEDEFLPIDFLFAAKIFPAAPQPAARFLAYLLKSAREGHLCVCVDLLDGGLKEGLSLIPPSLFETFLVLEEGRIYLRRTWEHENRFLIHLKRLRSQKPACEIPAEWLNERLKNELLNVEQKRAIKQAAANALTLISGGPGTGKTYTAATLLRLFFEGGVRNMIVAAPTGKATANMRTALGPLAEKCTIQTLHSLVRKEKLEADLIVIDEGSMVDAERMSKLFRGVKEGARLVLLGDKDQLPPVESGNFFADLSKDPTLITELKICLRTELQGIIDQAAQVKRGEVIPTLPLPDLKTLLKIIMEQEIHVLTPLRKGIYGVDHLNQQLYREHQKRGDRKIPIMITANDPYVELFNGDTGFLCKEEKMAYFSGGRRLPEHLLPPYDYAYVLSVHKSQGSEYEHVMILLPQGAEHFGREVLYTALTRAKKTALVYAHEGIVEQLVRNQTERFSGYTVPRSNTPL